MRASPNESNTNESQTLKEEVEYEIFILDSLGDKVVLTLLEVLITSIGCALVTLIIQINEDLPINQQNLTDNIILKNVCPIIIFDIVITGLLIIVRILIGPLPEFVTNLYTHFLCLHNLHLVLNATYWNILNILYKSLKIRIGQLDEDFCLM